MKMKKIITMALAAVLSLAMSTAAFADSGMTDKEQELLDLLNGGFTAGNIEYSFSDEDLAKAENYLLANDVADDGVDLIIGNIDEVVELVKKSGADSIKNLDKATINKIAELANEAAQVVGLEAKVNGDGNIDVLGEGGAVLTEVALTEAKGDDVKDNGTTNNGGSTDTKTPIKKTGFGLEATAAVVALLSVAFVSAAVVSKRKSVEA